MRYAMIMAGGAGTRLWPMSRRDRPKQLLPFIGGQSLLEIAAARLDGIVPPERRLICTGEAHRDAVRSALPSFTDDNILGEPEGRDTVNAAGLTAAVLMKRDPAAMFAVFTSDHLIEPLDEFQQKIQLGLDLVEGDATRFVTFAITPSFPATQYGYVERGNAIPEFEGAYEAKHFCEKPTLAKAKEYVRDGAFAWNSGMFVFHAGQFMDAVKRFWPGSYDGLMKIAESYDTPRRAEVLRRVYPDLPKKSVDFAIMEPAARDDAITVCCVPMDVQWMDVGSWPSYGDTLKADAHDNRTNARVLHLDSRNTLAVADDPKHTIATIGCDDLIIVRTADVTLVCPRSEAQRVKDLVDLADESLR